MLDFLYFLSLPRANPDVARSSQERRGGDLSKTLSAVSSKMRPAVRWRRTRLVISLLCHSKSTVGEKLALCV